MPPKIIDRLKEIQDHLDAIYEISKNIPLYAIPWYFDMQNMQNSVARLLEDEDVS